MNQRQRVLIEVALAVVVYILAVAWINAQLFMELA